ncbi:MAG: hypothetical protein Q4F60_00055 [Candidatus Saccharibacteria bacterium]|nr:hypothetical protein [Candidatus Saccharibacteria bacterium]
MKIIIADPFKKEREQAKREKHDWVKWYSQNTLLHNLWREGKICSITDAEITTLMLQWTRTMQQLGYSDDGIFLTWKKLEEASGKERLLYDPGWRTTIYHRGCQTSMGFIPFNVNLAAGNMADSMMMARGWITNPDGVFQKIPKNDRAYVEMIHNPCWIAVGERDELIARWTYVHDAKNIAVLGAGYAPEFWTTGFPLEGRQVDLFEHNPRVELKTFISKPMILGHFKMNHTDVQTAMRHFSDYDELPYDAVVMPGLASYIYDSLPMLLSVILPRLKAGGSLIFDLELENPAMRWVVSTLTWLDEGMDIVMPLSAAEAECDIIRMVRECSHGEAYLAQSKVISAGWDKPQMILFEVRKNAKVVGLRTAQAMRFVRTRQRRIQSILQPA